MADVVLKIDADTAGYIAKIAQLAKAQEQAMEKTKGFGGAVGGIAKEFAAAALGAFTLSQMVEAVGTAIKNARDNAVSLSTSFGARAISAGNALSQLGLNKATVESDIQRARVGSVAVNGQQLQGFYSSLASLNQQRETDHLPKLTPEQSQALINAYSAYGDAGLGIGGASLLLNFQRSRGYGLKLSAADIDAKASALADERGAPASSVTNEYLTERAEALEKEKQYHPLVGRQIRQVRAAANTEQNENILYGASREILRHVPIFGSLIDTAAEKWYSRDDMAPQDISRHQGTGAHGPAALLINALTRTMGQTLNHQRLRTGNNGHTE